MLTDHNEIHKWMVKNTSNEQSISGHTTPPPGFAIRPDGVVDAGGGIEIWCEPSVVIPVRFGSIMGNFRVRRANIKSLDWLPSHIYGFLDFSINLIASLSGIDKVVKHVNNKVFPPPDGTHLLGLLLIDGVTSIGSDYGIESLCHRILSKYCGTGDILSAQDELIDAGFIAQARL
jgi:hypothetical protein